MDSCKLADFGLARIWNRSASPTAHARGIVAGSGRYIAPEVLRGQAISPAADMWSFGVTLWEMSLRRKFPSRDAILPSGTHAPRWRRTLEKYSRYVTNPPSAVQAVIASCLRVDPRERATSEEAFFAFLYLADDASGGVGGAGGRVGLELPLPSITESEAAAATNYHPHVGDAIITTGGGGGLSGLTEESLSGTSTRSAQTELRKRFSSLRMTRTLSTKISPH